MTNIQTQDKVTKRREGHVLAIGVNRPEKKNAFDVDVLRGLALAYAELAADPELRCGVLHGHGADFTAGLDLASVAPIIARGDGATILPEGGIDPWGVQTPPCPKPIVVAVQGRCLTLGIELILASDICIAADDVSFAQIEIKRGIFPFGGATLRMPAAFGWQNAMRYLLTGDAFDASEAYRLGLVQEIVPAGTQFDRAMSLAATIAEQSPLGVYATLESARATVREGFTAAADALAPKIASLFNSEDAKEGLRSFLERRPAKFEGR